MKLSVVALFVFIGHFHFAQLTYVAYFKNPNGTLASSDMMRVNLGRDFRELVTSIDPTKASIVFFLLEHNNAIFTNEQGNTNYHGIVEYLATRSITAAAVLIQLSHDAIGLCIDSLRIIREESHRTISIGHDYIPFFPYPTGTVYYLNAGKIGEEKREDITTASPLINILQEIVANPPNPHPDPEMRYGLNVLLLCIPANGDILFENEYQYIEEYLKYLYHANNNAFIIILNDALFTNGNWNPEFDILRDRLDAIGGIYVTTSELRPYQTYPVPVTYNGQPIPAGEFVYKF